ncbi:apolipoprotein N-acyltransferase [Roseivivax sediminis]|uniref:Apolipoprotein N-acyltransferase n=1 Tax=Roseivivax sediminis TaxID=936889 RepID=A0A1I1TC67_9RHOB|nr:apolipoprotein N-acyltransferase [Roseivivax sediminis]SFD56179.1 Apolipoprotein N-acyltransferase [Roseivivax sediminis]
MADTALARGRALGRWCRLALAAAFGGLFGLGQAPFDLWYIAPLGLVAIFVLLRSLAVPTQAGWSAWAFGAGYFGLSLSWIVEPFFVDAAVTGWMAPFALLGLAGGLALFWALPVWSAWRIGRPVLAVPLWALFELSRAYVLTGFPWGLVGYVWTPSAGAQWAAVVGPHGLTFVTLALAALAAHGLSARDWRTGAGAVLGTGVLLLGGLALAPAPATAPDAPVVRLVQPNAPQHLKWRRDMIPVYFQRQIAATRAEPRPDLIVWPETALPMLLHNSNEAREIIDEAAQGVPVVLGIQREEAGNWYNSAIAIGPRGRIADVYDKHHLVPFGEYMPARWFFEHIEISGLAARAEGGYSAGPGPRLLDLGALGTALPLICYEAVFPQDVTGAPERPRMLLQLTNDAWFGTWSGPYQHLAQARMRAIETGLPLLRAANTGVSAVIDGGGRVRTLLPLGEAGHIDHPLPPALAPTLYSRTGDWPALLAILSAVLSLILLHPRSKRSGQRH